MAKSFQELVKNRKKNKDKLQEKISKENAKSSQEKDPRFWDHSHIINEKTKKGMAKIRFLPAPPGEDEPYVKQLKYFQKSPYNQFYYVHVSHKTYDKDAEDPAYEHNGAMYKKYDKDEAKKHAIRRQKGFISNILVIDDPKEPENNGKEFLYEYGPQIFEKIEKELEYDEDMGETEDDSRDIFDPIEGAVFVLRITPKKLGDTMIHTYETSSFEEESTPLAETEEEMEAIWKRCHKLQPFVDPENTEIFKPIEQQRKDFARWLGEEDTNEAPSKSEDEPSKTKKEKTSKVVEEDDDEDEIPFSVDEDEDSDEEVASDDDGDDDIDEFFKNLK